MDTNSPKPSKADLLKELESIRDSLVSDGEDIQTALSGGKNLEASETTPTKTPMEPNPSTMPIPDAPVAEANQSSEKPHSLMKKSFLEIDESDYDLELKIPAHAAEISVKEPVLEEESHELSEPAAEVKEEAIQSNADEELALDDRAPEAAHSQIDVEEFELDEETQALLDAEDEAHASEVQKTADQSTTVELIAVEPVVVDTNSLEPSESDETELDELSEIKNADLEQELSEKAASLESSQTLKEAPANSEVSIDETLEHREEAQSAAPAPASETPTMEVPAIDDFMIRQQLETSNALKPLPGQQSLFDDAVAPASPAAIKPKATPAPPKPVENPFLPQHIKAKLERERSLYEQEINAAVQTNSAKRFNTAVRTSPTVPSMPAVQDEEAPVQEARPSAHEALIDDLVKEYLPKIEATLRERLRERLAENSSE